MSVSWLFFAFSGPVLWAISTHLDKYLVEQYFKHTHPAVLLIFTALATLVMLPIIWGFALGALDIGIKSTLLMLLSGVLLMGAMLFYLWALQSEEASVVAPFFQASPLFGYALGYTFLGEVLSQTQLLGAALIILGALAASAQAKGAHPKFNRRLVLLMLACAFTASLSSLIFKIVALHDNFWATTFWLFAGEAIFGGILLAVSSLRAQFFNTLKSNTAAVLSISAANELINLGGALGVRYALTLAPLSLVQAIGSTTTVLVFVFGIALSVFFPTVGREDLSGDELARKGAAAILVALGVILVNY
jgi:uncharacterized membrane protein